MEPEDLTEPLLGCSNEKRDSPDQIDAAKHGFTDNLQTLIVTLRNAIAAIWRYILTILRPRRQIRTLSLVQAARLETLQERAAVMYDAEDPQHVEYLRRLWEVVWPDEDFPEGIRSSQWKLMGWQGEDPGTDFRGGGLLSLEALLHMAETEKGVFLNLMQKVQGPRSELDYPFAAAGVNLTYMLVETLELRRPAGHVPSTPAGRGFLHMLSQSEHAFESVFIEAFRLLDELWIHMGATYMEFPAVMSTVRQRVVKLLADAGPPR